MIGGARVLGLDLSISATGIAHVDGTTSTVGGPSTDGDLRLPRIRTAIARAARDGDAELAVIESVPPAMHNQAANETVHMVHGVTREVLLRHRVPYVHVHPGALKKYATGNGGASKQEMADALWNRHGLRLDDDNQVDAAWLRLMAIHTLADRPLDIARMRRDLHDPRAQRARAEQRRDWLRGLTYHPTTPQETTP